MSYIDFISVLHKSTKRDYIARLTDKEKAAVSATAKKYGYDYWDGDRKTGYGGYRYDGRWRAVADMMARQYRLKAGDNVLDVGCGKGFLLYDITQSVPGVNAYGLDISEYAIEHSKDEIKHALKPGNANSLPYPDKTFDYVYSITTLHNLKIYDLMAALKEIERVKKPDGHAYICVESFRNEQERINLFAWQLTCEAFYSVDEWEWIFNNAGYSGDHSFIFFE